MTSKKCVEIDVEKRKVRDSSIEAAIQIGNLTLQWRNQMFSVDVAEFERIHREIQQLLRQMQSWIDVLHAENRVKEWGLEDDGKQ